MSEHVRMERNAKFVLLLDIGIMHIEYEMR